MDVYQGDIGPFNPGLQTKVPLWLAMSLKQRQKCRIIAPDWMDSGNQFSLLGFCYTENRICKSVWKKIGQIMSVPHLSKVCKCVNCVDEFV